MALLGSLLPSDQFSAAFLHFPYTIKEMSPEERKKLVARTVMFGGKAFATYAQAKRIVKLITDVGAVVNNDSDVGGLLKVSNKYRLGICVSQKK